MNSIGWLMLIIGGAKLLLSALFGGNIFGSGGIIDGLAVIFVIGGIVLITIQKVSTQKEIAAQDTERATIMRGLEQSDDIDLIIKSLDSSNSWIADKAVASLPRYQQKHPNDQRIAQLLKNTYLNVRIKAIMTLLELSIAQKDRNAMQTVLTVLKDTREYYVDAKSAADEHRGKEFRNVIEMVVATGFKETFQPFFEETAVYSIFSIFGLLLIGKPVDDEGPISSALLKLKSNPGLLPSLALVSDLFAQKVNPDESIPIFQSFLVSTPLKGSDRNKLRISESIKWILKNRAVSADLQNQIKSIGNIIIYSEPAFSNDYNSSDGEEIHFLDYIKSELLDEELG